jgi:hypothetical protein
MGGAVQPARKAVFTASSTASRFDFVPFVALLVVRAAASVAAGAGC